MGSGTVMRPSRVYAVGSVWAKSFASGPMVKMKKGTAVSEKRTLMSWKVICVCQSYQKEPEKTFIMSRVTRMVCQSGSVSRVRPSDMAVFSSCAHLRGDEGELGGAE